MSIRLVLSSDGPAILPKLFQYKSATSFLVTVVSSTMDQILV
jgi:hypothetical protein